MNFQERYKKYQEAMRAQDANRRRHPSSDTMRDNFSGRPLSVGSSKPAPPLPPPPPPRAMIQSASVCDLTAAHMWNPGMHQVRRNPCVFKGRSSTICCTIYYKK